VLALIQVYKFTSGFDSELKTDNLRGSAIKPRNQIHLVFCCHLDNAKFWCPEGKSVGKGRKAFDIAHAERLLRTKYSWHKRN